MPPTIEEAAAHRGKLKSIVKGLLRVNTARMAKPEEAAVPVYKIAAHFLFCTWGDEPDVISSSPLDACPIRKSRWSQGKPGAAEPYRVQTKGDVAQMGEHLPCTQKVAGSMPVISTKQKRNPIGVP